METGKGKMFDECPAISHQGKQNNENEKIFSQETSRLDQLAIVYKMVIKEELKAGRYAGGFGLEPLDTSHIPHRDSSDFPTAPSAE
jgi:hypothetical protein